MRHFIASLVRRTSAVAIFTLALSVAVAQNFAPVPYTPGQSWGPVGSDENPLSEADDIAYAQAYWQSYDLGDPDFGPLSLFEWNHPEFLPYNDSNFIPVDVDPFGEGRVLFEDLYEHRLSDVYGFEDLIDDDPLIRLTWRHWTLTRQVATVDFIDPIAHQRHIDALIMAIVFDDGYATRGVPYFSASTIVSDRTKKKKPNGTITTPTPADVSTLAQKIQDFHACICMKVGVISGFPDLYDPDNEPAGDPGFDCDDFADALGAYVLGQTTAQGVTAKNKYVSWTNSAGKGVAHLVTMISFCGYYWLLDAQTGNKIGPFADGTKIDASPLINAGYDVKADSSVDTSQKCYDIGDRGDWKGEPKPWYEDMEMRDHFENETGLDADDFDPPGYMPPAQTGN